MLITSHMLPWVFCYYYFAMYKGKFTAWVTILHQKTILVLKRHHAGISVSYGKSNGNYKINYYITSAFIIFFFFLLFLKFTKPNVHVFSLSNKYLPCRLCVSTSILPMIFSGYWQKYSRVMLKIHSNRIIN